MKLLLDTHVALWVLDDDPRLSDLARALVEDEQNSCFVSAASVWEVAIKFSTGKLQAPPGFPARFHEEMALRGIAGLPVYDIHAAAVADLPPHHRDPFDRLLVAQGMTEDVAIVSKDEILNAYDVTVLW